MSGQISYMLAQFCKGRSSGQKTGLGLGHCSFSLCKCTLFWINFSVSLLLYCQQHSLAWYENVSSGKETQGKSVNFSQSVAVNKIHKTTVQMPFMATAYTTDCTSTGNTSVKGCCSETSTEQDQRQSCTFHRKRKWRWIKENFGGAGLLHILLFCIRSDFKRDCKSLAFCYVG